MSDTPAKPGPDDDETTEDVLDGVDEQVFAADDTGMLAGERLITVAEIADAGDAHKR